MGGHLDAKFWGISKLLRGCKCMLPSWHWNYMGACFQAPRCCTQTMTDGNTLCLLIKSFILQHTTFDKIMCTTFNVTVMNRSVHYENNTNYSNTN